MGANVGHEQDDKGKLWTRLVLVVRKFNKHSLWAIPLTTKGKPDNPYYFEITVGTTTSYLVLSQLRLISSNRLIAKIGTVEEAVVKEAAEQIRSLLP